MCYRKIALTPFCLKLVARAFCAGDSPLDDRARELRCEHLDELVGVAAQVSAALDSKARGAGFEEVARVDGAQVAIALRVEGHLREDADAEPELDIRFDHVGIERGQH